MRGALPPAGRIAAHRLAGAVAKQNAMGAISGVDLRRHHPDLMAQTGKRRGKAAIDHANLVALIPILSDSRGIALVLKKRLRKNRLPDAIKRGLFFRGSEPLPLGYEIRPVKDLLELLLTGALNGKQAGEQIEALACLQPA